jgi:two-component system response regulator DegU
MRAVPLWRKAAIVSEMTPSEEKPTIPVLIVDQNRTFLRAALDLLRRQPDLTVVGATGGGEEALVQVQSLRPQVVLVSLDAPLLAGVDTISRLRMRMPQVAIIALTMLSGEAYRRAAIFAGADAAVTKTNLTTDLLPIIRRLAHSYRYRDKQSE